MLTEVLFLVKGCVCFAVLIERADECLSDSECVC